MGLYFYASVDDFGLPAETPYYGFEPDYGEGMDVFADTFFNRACDLVPVDTGNLMGSISAYPGSDDVECKADCEYAQYVEFGTYKMSEQPYFIPALEEAYQEAMPYWRDAWHEALEEEQELIELEEEAEEAEERANAEQQAERQAAGGGGGIPGAVGEILGVILAAIVVAFFDMFMKTMTGQIDSGKSLFSSGFDAEDVEGSFSGAGSMASYVEIT